MCRLFTEQSNVSDFLPPANVVCEGYVFTHVCHSVHGGGASVVARDGGGGMRGCSWGGACVVALGACVVARGGMRGCSRGGCAWLLGGGACVVALGGVHAWLLWGVCMGYDEIPRYGQ